jgi:hypothetical protein
MNLSVSEGDHLRDPDREKAKRIGDAMLSMVKFIRISLPHTGPQQRGECRRVANPGPGTDPA